MNCKFKSFISEYPLLFAFCILVFITFVVYFPSLFSSFCLDDAIIFTASYPRKIEDIHYLLTEPVRCRVMNYYRPVTFLSFLIDYNISGSNPLGYHISNLLFASASVCLIFLFARIFFQYKECLLFSTLFAVYPGHSEAVLGIYNRSQMLSAIFTLCALVCFQNVYKGHAHLKRSLFFSTLCALAGCLSKESSLVLPALSLLVFLCDKPEISQAKRAFLAIGLQSLSCGIYLILRYNALGTWGVHEVDPFFPPGETYFNASKIFWHYILFAFIPFPMSIDYPWQAVDFHWAGFFLPFVFFFAIRSFLKYKNYLFFFPLFFFFLNLITVLHIMPLQIAFAERFLYSAYPAVCFVWIFLFRHIRSKSIVFLFLCSMAFLTFQRCFDWKDNLVLWQKTLQTTPQSYRAYIYLASQSIREKQYEKVLPLLEKALELKPNRQNLLIIEYNKALLYQQLNQPEKTKQHLQKALNIYPYHQESLILLADILSEQNQHTLALSYYEKACQRQNRFSPRHQEVIEKTAAIFSLQKKYEQAIALYSKVLSFAKEKQDIHQKLAFLYIEQKDFPQAKKCLEQCNPEDYKTLYLFYLFYKKQGDHPKATLFYEKAHKKH